MYTRERNGQVIYRHTQIHPEGETDYLYTSTRMQEVAGLFVYVEQSVEKDWTARLLAYRYAHVETLPQC